MKKFKVGIYGCGMVGGALKRYFESKSNYDVFFYDKKGLGSLEELNKADFVYVCLPTPYVPGVGCDTSIIKSAIEEIDDSKVIIIKSTVEPGTTDELQKIFPQHKFLFNPEFLTELTADQDMKFPDRQIIGYTPQSYTIAEEIMLQLPLAPFEKIMPARVAEMVKYANNTWFAVKVAINNELYDLCKGVGFSEEDWENVVTGVACDKRVGRTHLKIYHKDKRGYWGKCLPKDIKALIEYAKKNGINMPIREATNQYNDQLLRSQGIKEYV